MRFIHTSDWHLGRRLYGKTRYREFEQFLDWLASYIEANPIDALLVCGDIFDTTTPGNRALSLYYRFLHRIGGTTCRHVVVIAGNHDSPTLLEAPRELLGSFNIHVIGMPRQKVEEQVLQLSGNVAGDKVIVCAVPFLRDRDIRTAVIGEDIATKSAKLEEAVHNHYRMICEAAETIRTRQDSTIPIIAMGHLFTAGGKTVEGDGVRELYVGGLAHLAGEAFPACIDYLALGHLHIAQRVQGKEHLRYSGSPIPMGFNEAGQQKWILDVACTGTGLQVEQVKVPLFQQLISLKGDLEHLCSELEKLKEQGSTAWLEIYHTGLEEPVRLRETLHRCIEGTALSILRIRTGRKAAAVLSPQEPEETLEELSVEDVFTRCLDASDPPPGVRDDMLLAFQEIIASLDEPGQEDR